MGGRGRAVAGRRVGGQACASGLGEKYFCPGVTENVRAPPLSRKLHEAHPRDCFTGQLSRLPLPPAAPPRAVPCTRTLGIQDCRRSRECKNAPSLGLHCRGPLNGCEGVPAALPTTPCALLRGNAVPRPAPGFCGVAGLLRDVRGASLRTPCASPSLAVRPADASSWPVPFLFILFMESFGDRRS